MVRPVGGPCGTAARRAKTVVATPDGVKETLLELQEIQSEALADDIAIDFERMSIWSEARAREYFESGGQK